MGRDQHPELMELRKRLEIAEAVAASYRSSARIHGMRADGLAGEANHFRRLATALSPGVRGKLRILRLLANGHLPSGIPISLVRKRALEILKEEGFAGLKRKVEARVPALRRRLGAGSATSQSASVQPPSAETKPDPLLVYDQSVASGRQLGLTPKILIIAELTLRQCAKYRVWQRQEQLESLGWQVQVVDWRDAELALTALQSCTEVIFYRVPAFEPVKVMIAEARRLSLSPWWEVDDLIFDAAQYRENGNIDSLSEAERKELLFGVGLFRTSLLSCGRGIASTRSLAAAMQEAGVETTAVIENALDQHTLDIATALRSQPRVRSEAGDIVILYGSGTRTHDADFREAAAGILQAMADEPRLRLRIVGDLSLPEAFEALGDRVEHLIGRDYPAYLALLSQADITIAPLEATRFNDAKSNIKFLEAAIVHVPAICSPRDAFAQVVRDGENGLLADSAEEWRDAILKLVKDRDLASSLADRAELDVCARYSPDAITDSQVAKIFPHPGRMQRDKLSLLSVNVYFAPRSFGGATFIAEEMAHRLSAEQNMEVGVFTSRAVLPDRHASMLRYAVDGMQVASGIVPNDHDRVAGLDNPRVTEQFETWLAAFRPDVVHFHSVQGLGLGMLWACVENGIPYVVTLHDAWFLCDRQFMVQESGHYCFQRRIDERVCQACEPSARHLHDRSVMMRNALAGAALLLTPSAVHRALYLENGVPPEKIAVNRNGFLWPKAERRKRIPGAPLRFGYVGGTESVKGYPLVREAFEALERNDWELVLVDNKLNLGFASIHVSHWKVSGTLTVRPAYNVTTMDDFFSDIDVLLFPSQWMESYGLTVREALARDVWVIATGPGGQAEDIVDGVNGTLIPLDGKSDSLQKSVEMLLEQSEMFDSYVNPHKAQLASFDGQTAELASLIRSVAGR